jgi:Tfp pilus assembly protein PilF
VGTAAGAPSTESAPARTPWWRRRRIRWIAAAVAIFLGFEIWLGIQQEKQKAGGVDRVRAETLNNLGMEKLQVFDGQAIKDWALVGEARDLFADAVVADTTYAVPHNNLGRLAMDNDEYPVAQREFRTALRLDPEYASAYLNMAALLERENRPEDAVSYYRAAMRFDDSENKDVMKTAANNLGYFYLASREEPDSALAVLEPAVEQFPDVPALSKNYGLALLAVGRVDEAEKAMNAAAEAGGDRLPQVVAGLIAVAEAKGDSAAATERWGDLLKLVGPDDAEKFRGTALDIAGIKSGSD